MLPEGESSQPDNEVTSLPGAEDRLFQEIAARRTWTSEWEREHDWYHYVTGYKDAADALFARLESGGRAIKLGPPIVFLYRHHLELAIKQLMRDCAVLLGRQPLIPQHHRLDELWRVCLSLLVEVCPGSTATAEVRHTTRLIDEFCRVDRTSEAFRYPEDKAGEPSLAGVEDVCVYQVREAASKISLLLECIGAEIGTME